jgi:hypothetical protein
MAGGQFQNLAHNLCQMFCGWRLTSSKARLVLLGSGFLHIDAVLGYCDFHDELIDPLPIVSDLCASVKQHLRATNSPEGKLIDAELTVRLTFSVVPWNEEVRESFYTGGTAVRTKEMHRCVMQCRSDVIADDAAYQSELTQVQEWPIGWPSE